MAKAADGKAEIFWNMSLYRGVPESTEMSRFHIMVMPPKLHLKMTINKTQHSRCIK